MKYLAIACLPLLFVPSLRAQQRLSSPASENLKAGERLYLQRCSLCHSGKPPRFQTLGPPLDSELITSRGDESIRKTIAEGSARMPGFRYTLDETQVTRIVEYLKTLKDSSFR